MYNKLRQSLTHLFSFTLLKISIRKADETSSKLPVTV